MVQLGNYALQGILNERKCSLVMESMFDGWSLTDLPQLTTVTSPMGSFIFPQTVVLKSTNCDSSQIDLPLVEVVQLPGALQKVRKASIESKEGYWL